MGLPYPKGEVFFRRNAFKFLAPEPQEQEFFYGNMLVGSDWNHRFAKGTAKIAEHTNSDISGFGPRRRSKIIRGRQGPLTKSLCIRIVIKSPFRSDFANATAAPSRGFWLRSNGHFRDVFDHTNKVSSPLDDEGDRYIDRTLAFQAKYILIYAHT